WRLDLSRGQEKAGLVPYRERQADEGRYPPRENPEGCWRTIQPRRRVHRHANGLLEEPEGRQGFPALGPHEAGIRAVVYLAASLYQRRDYGMGGGSGVGCRPGAAPI